MAQYDDDAPGSMEDWHDGERWTLAGVEGGWTDAEQFARECPDCEPAGGWDGVDPPAYDGEAC